MKWLRNGGHPIKGDPSKSHAGLKLCANISGTWLACFLSTSVNLFQESPWHTDIESNRVQSTKSGFDTLCCGFCILLCFCSHLISPFKSIRNGLNLNVYNGDQHFSTIFWWLPIVPPCGNFENTERKEKTMTQATHTRIKTKTKVIVERFEGNVLVVKNLKGKILGSYDRTSMDKFNDRYKTLAKTGDAGRG